MLVAAVKLLHFGPKVAFLPQEKHHLLRLLHFRMMHLCTKKIFPIKTMTATTLTLPKLLPPGPALSVAIAQKTG